MSIYREEAIEALIEGLRRKDFLNFQIRASDALISLSGRLTSSGKSYNEELLLKIAGFDQPYNTVMKEEKLILHETESKETMVCFHIAFLSHLGPDSVVYIPIMNLCRCLDVDSVYFWIFKL